MINNCVGVLHKEITNTKSLKKVGNNMDDYIDLSFYQLLDKSTLIFFYTYSVFHNADRNSFKGNT